jgi:hypothetical protein
MEQIQNVLVSNPVQTTYGDLEKSFEEQTREDFVLFWNCPAMKQLRDNGLLML